MLKQKIEDLLIIVLVVLAVILAYFLVIGFNRMAAQAKSDAPGFLERDQGYRLEGVDSLESEADVPKQPLAIGGTIEEQQSGEVKLTYQDVYTGPTTIGAPGEIEYDAQEVRETDGIGGIGGQSTNTGSEFIPASAFRHEGIVAGSQYEILTFGNGIGGYFRNNSPSFLCIAAPVYLPDGATFTRFYQYFVDSDPTFEMWRAQLWRREQTGPLPIPPPDTSAQVVADLDFLFNIPIDSIFVFRGSSTLIVTPGSQNISNNYGYYISYCFEPNSDFDHRIYGFRVDYTLP